jgi:hypothetical protein
MFLILAGKCRSVGLFTEYGFYLCVIVELLCDWAWIISCVFLNILVCSWYKKISAEIWRWLVIPVGFIILIDPELHQWIFAFPLKFLAPNLWNLGKSVFSSKKKNLRSWSLECASIKPLTSYSAGSVPFQPGALPSLLGLSVCECHRFLFCPVNSLAFKMAR